MGEGAARAKVFNITALPLLGDKKKEEKERRNRIIELQRNEMFEQKIISLTCSLEAQPVTALQELNSQGVQVFCSLP